MEEMARGETRAKRRKCVATISIWLPQEKVMKTERTEKLSSLHFVLDQGPQ